MQHYVDSFFCIACERSLHIAILCKLSKCFLITTKLSRPEIRGNIALGMYLEYIDYTTKKHVFIPGSVSWIPEYYLGDDAILPWG